MLVDRALGLLPSRTPSMIEAWLSSSEMIAEPSPHTVANNPVLAFQHATYVSDACVPRNAAIRSSSVRWISNVPQIKRTDAVPAPYLRSPSIPGFDDLGMIGETEVVVAGEHDDVAGFLHVHFGRHRRRQVPQVLVGARGL